MVAATMDFDVYLPPSQTPEKGVVIMTNSDNATNLVAEIVHSIAAEYGFPPE
jgi:hypothetical protein